MTGVYVYEIISQSALPLHLTKTPEKERAVKKCIQKWSSIIKITEKVKKTTGKIWQAELQNCY